MASSDVNDHDYDDASEVDSPAKRRRLSYSRIGRTPPQGSLFAGFASSTEYASKKTSAVADNCDDEKTNISISATSKQAGRTVAPFLAKHIPDQYAPTGGGPDISTRGQKDSNTKYCYRHRPDLKCRRQANEPSMDQLQHV